MKGNVTAVWLAPIRLVAALLIVVGLAVSVPPSLSASVDDHFGLLLHPLFPHVHGPADALYVSDAGASVSGDAPSLTSDTGPAAVDQLPGLRSQSADEGFRTAVSGIVLPAILAGLLLHLRQLQLAELRVAQQPWRGPPTPPPRRSSRSS